MNLLIKAALRSRRHLMLALFTLISLLMLTFADQMERFSLGLLANNGADFFVLFGNGGKSSEVHFKDVERRWKKIDRDFKGRISKQDAMLYLSKRKDRNPLARLLNQFSTQFDLQKNFVSVVLVLVFVALYKAIVLFSSRYATQVLSIRVTRDLRLQYFEHLQMLPLSFYNDYNLGSLTSRAIGDAGQIASSLNSCLTNYLQTPFTIVSTLLFCFYLSWKLSLVIFIGLPLIIGPVVFLTKRVKRISRQMQKNQEHFTSVLLDFLTGIQTIKIFAIELFSLRKFKCQNDRIAYLESKNAKYALLTRPVLHTITTGCLVFVAIVGLYTLHMTVVQLLVFCGLLHLFYEPVKKFAEENANIQKGAVAAERMFEVLHLKPAFHDGDEELLGFQKGIVFDKVSFKYKDDWVIKDLSFSVKKGETVALIGPTGAGKSTVVQLIPRLYDIQEGSIAIDGKDIRLYTQKSLREQIAFVPQKPFIFYDTVLENISFGKKLTREEIEESAKKAYAHEFIKDLPKQYDTLLLDAGKNLSGGQQQRIAIARALVKNAPILILDEATSALDSISEETIRLALQALAKKMTQIIIAHRLSTVEHADRIIFLDKGRKIADGTKEDLYKNCVLFRMMWDQQFKTI